MNSVLIGNELRALRSRMNLSLKDVEQKTGIYAQKLSIYENGKVNIRVCTLEKILDAYNSNLYIFFKDIYEYTHKKDGDSDNST